MPATKKKTLPSKAVVFVLDASPSMNAPFPSQPSPSSSTTTTTARTPSKSTRLSAAKDAVIHGLAELMKSTKNEANVIVCKTRETTRNDDFESIDETSEVRVDDDESDGNEDMDSSDSKDDVDDDSNDENDDSNDEDSRHLSQLQDSRHLTQLERYMSVVSDKLLHKVNNVQSQLSPSVVDQVKSGTVLHGLFKARRAFSLRKKNERQGTNRNKDPPANQIVILTDAQHTIEWEVDDVVKVANELIEMNCPVHLILVVVPEESSKGSSDDKECDSRSSDSSDDDDSLDRNVALLRRISDKTGGEVISALTPQAVFEAVEAIIKGKKRAMKATKNKVELVILPDLVVNVRRSNLFVKANLPTAKTDSFFLMDEKGNDFLDQEGEQRTDKAYKTTFYTDGEDVVDAEDVAKAVKYGNDLVMMSAWDYKSLWLKDSPDKPRYEILCFLEESRVPKAYIMGPPYVISGEDSDIESQAMVAALAQALEQLKEVAICIVRTKERDGALVLPILGALYPFKEPSRSTSTTETLPTKLLFLRLPFEGEVQDMLLGSLEQDEDDPQAKACDDLVDALMLPPGVLDICTVPNPMTRSWDQTLVKRVLDPTAEVVSVRTPDKHDPMRTPSEILEQAKPALDCFWKTFNLPTSKPKEDTEDDKKEGKGKKKGKKALYYKDFL